MLRKGGVRAGEREVERKRREEMGRVAEGATEEARAAQVRSDMFA